MTRHLETLPEAPHTPRSEPLPDRLVRARYRRSAVPSEAPPQTSRAAPGGRRRPLRRRFVVLLLATLGAQGLLPFVPLEKEPAFDRAQARVLLRRAQRLFQEPLPEASSALARAARRAESSTAPGSTSGETWDPVLQRIGEGLRDLGALRQSKRQDWLEVEAQLIPAVRRAQQESAEPAMMGQEARWLREAETKAALAQRLAEGARWSEATAAAQAALAASEKVHVSWLRLFDRFTRPELQRQWQQWAEDAVSSSRSAGTTRLVVDKLDRTLTVYQRGKAVGAFPVELGVRGVVRKQHAGDRATPEGRYQVIARKTGPQTRYYKALLLDYPNAEDLARLRRSRRLDTAPRGVGAGGLIEIHGGGGRGRDWTDGCIALRNQHMDRLFQLLTTDTQVTIVGTLGRSSGRS